MRYTYSESARLTFVNPPFHTERGLDSRAITVTVDVGTDVPINPGDYGATLLTTVEAMSGSNWVAVDDAFILKLLEPKTGNTVHNFLTRLKDWFSEDANRFCQRLGGTIPPDTINGYVVYVLAPGVRPTLEAVARVIANAFPPSDNTRLTLTDGKLTVSGTVAEFNTYAGFPA